MTKEWNKLKATIAELRDNGGKGSQEEVCKYLVELMDVIESKTTEEYISKEILVKHFKDKTEGWCYKSLHVDQIIKDIREVK